MKELENLRKKRDDYTFEEVWLKLHDNYSIDTDMEHKVMDLY